MAAVAFLFRGCSPGFVVSLFPLPARKSTLARLFLLFFGPSFLSLLSGPPPYSPTTPDSCQCARLRLVAHHHRNKEKPRGEVLAVQEAKAAEEWELHWALIESPVPQQLVQYDLPKVNAQGGTPSLWSARDHDESLDNKVRVVSAHIIKAREDDAKSVVTPLLLARVPCVCCIPGLPVDCGLEGSMLPRVVEWSFPSCNCQSLRAASQVAPPGGSFGVETPLRKKNSWLVRAP
jgi:hypothetical protein